MIAFVLTRFRRAPALFVAAALVVLLAALSPGQAPASAATQARTPITIVTVHANGRTYVLKVWARVRGQRCLPHAYGAPVRRFLSTHDCRGVTRFLVTTTVDGRGVGFAQSSLGFAGRTAAAAYQAAGGFRALVTQKGTGNFYSLFHDGYSLPSGPQSVPCLDTFTALVQDAGVTVVDSWYLHGTTPGNVRPLERMARDIYLQWSA